MERPNKEAMKPESTKEAIDCAIWYSAYAKELEKYCGYLEQLVKNSCLDGVMHWVSVEHNNPTIRGTYFTRDDQGFMGFRTWKDTFWEGENIVGEGKVTHWMKLDPPCA